MELPNRKTIRAGNYDYNTAGTYFLTICTQNRRCLLSRIVGTGVLDGPRVELTKYGEIADKYINQMDHFYEHISVERYVIMPNHIHLLLRVKNGPSRTPVPTAENGPSRTPVPTAENGPTRTSIPTAENGPSGTPVPTAENGPSRTPVPTVQNSIVSQFVSTFKRFCNKEYGENIWQRSSYDHIIRDRHDYEAKARYIYENPMAWYYDELYSEI